ncbi:putative multi antimicrobial extrusion protein [Helianthus annuus]|uniref:Protein DETOXIFICATION n=1 Tax=Helianthus annuus TaxID=4232 RepID=A0A251U2Z1_HELAN|nr:protein DETOXIFICATION 12 [Helianthus annuus]XP_021976461.1 protein DETOXIFICATION 12 [Helianthus annuus]KAF5794031.1 putative multi antimicrobial extrusion protein [Helianthus annuus]KAJ0552341.1 putative multi antimicrobial extrusion protein [Helianthus annuus]KAJ0718042.1 putative multi antimicrobial extrusion protein [Helianthus annuus]KAJ0896441.1 putative multi antimicrobial extrusion protein [Helianthus annuus]
MEEGLILKPKDNRPTWRVLAEEMKKLGFIAAPMMAVTLSQFLLQYISIMMVGHLGELSLSSTSIAISLSSVTGFSLLMGMSSALETLCGQAYGAQQYTKVGVQTYTAIFSLLIVCIPLAFVWRYTESLLLLMGQSASISYEAGKFITCLIPALFAYAILQPLVRYFQMQSMLLPVLASSIAALCLHIPLCWALVYRTGLGNIGAAVSMGVGLWSNVVFLLLYMKYSPSCAKTRSPISVDVFYGMKQFFSFAIPSAVMLCLQWWSNEFIILISGLLPNPELETSVLSICLSTIAIVYAIPYGFAAGVSTRVSNELGAGNARGARVAVNAIMILAVVETTIVAMIVFFNRHIFGYIFTNEKEVVDHVTKITPFLCVSIVMDGLQGTFSGVARGVGWQHLGAYTNLGAFYLVGIPVAIVLGFCTSLKGEGLWIGILIGAIVQVISLSVITLCTNYEKQATKARERLSEEECALL